ncbi:helix-turn-helix domain-containing protein [Longispora albida]|uniref:helix-turn-helix domain-containing protein n=1 Tax=Longispora albida TaxID=203523 RepID=UPI000374CB3E|nr:LysR family transcriptional regulator [Longispora albida]
MHLELSHLRLVVAVAEADSLQAAAHQVQLSLPALLDRLRRIEEAFGGALFVLSGQYAEPTPAGWFAVGYARRIIARMADGWSGTRLVCGHQPGTK